MPHEVAACDIMEVERLEEARPAPGQSALDPPFLELENSNGRDGKQMTDAGNTGMDKTIPRWASLLPTPHGNALHPLGSPAGSTGERTPSGLRRPQQIGTKDKSSLMMPMLIPPAEMGHRPPALLLHTDSGHSTSPNPMCRSLDPILRLTGVLDLSSSVGEADSENPSANRLQETSQEANLRQLASVDRWRNSDGFDTPPEQESPTSVSESVTGGGSSSKSALKATQDIAPNNSAGEGDGERRNAGAVIFKDLCKELGSLPPGATTPLSLSGIPHLLRRYKVWAFLFTSTNAD
jgi:hypothetical protein